MIHSHPTPQPPCIVDAGTLINKRDMYRLLSDLGHVQYVDIVDRQPRREGEGYVMEVYADSQTATLVANRALYININSFDYLNLDTVMEPSGSSLVILDLVQDNRVLRLIPLTDPRHDRLRDLEESRAIQAAMVDAMYLDGDHSPIEDDHHYS